ncbi:MAG: hypothetical protein HPY53_04495 [Brevinematales bacterium]|nr:hypothetical protein [Brevinematales bacterium]
MRKLLFLIPLFALSSCALLHFFSPSANNTLNQPQWNTMHSLSGIFDARYYSITVDDSDRVYTAVYSTATMKFAVVFASLLSDEWATNFGMPASSMDALKVAYNKKWNLTFATQSSGQAQIVFSSSSSGFTAFGPSFSAAAMPDWDYFFNIYGDPFILTINSPSSFLIDTNNEPDMPGSTWVQYQSFNKDVGYSIMDYSADVDSHGNVFVGTGDFNHSQIYFNGASGVCASFNIPDGREYAKIAVDGSDNLYVIYKSTDDQIKVRIMSYTYPDISDNGAITLYNQSFFVGSSHKLGLSVAVDKNSTRIFVGFITMDNHKPMVIKIENGSAVPMPAFPEYMTNCNAIKLAVNQEGLPVAAILQPPTLHIFQTWY